MIINQRNRERERERRVEVIISSKKNVIDIRSRVIL